MDTVVLSRSAVIAATDLALLSEELGASLAGYSPGGSARRVRATVSDAVTAMVLVPGVCDGIPAYTVKVHAKVPGAAQAIRGVVLLHDLGTGVLLAIMDSGWLTAQRTALCAAVVHDRFVDREDPVAIVGAGVQGRAVAIALANRHPRPFVVTDTNSGAAQDLADTLELLGCRTQVVESRPPSDSTRRARPNRTGSPLGRYWIHSLFGPPTSDTGRVWATGSAHVILQWQTPEPARTPARIGGLDAYRRCAFALDHRPPSATGRVRPPQR